MVGKVIVLEKEIIKIVVDLDEEIVDIDMLNNLWLKEEKMGEFDIFKNKVKGE